MFVRWYSMFSELISVPELHTLSIVKLRELQVNRPYSTGTLYYIVLVGFNFSLMSFFFFFLSKSRPKQVTFLWSKSLCSTFMKTLPSSMISSCTLLHYSCSYKPTCSSLCLLTLSLHLLLIPHQRRGRKPLRWKSRIAEQFWSGYEFLNLNPRGKMSSLLNKESKLFWVFFISSSLSNSSFIVFFLCSLSLNLTHRLRMTHSKQVQRNDDAQIENRCDLHDWLQCNFTLICMDLLNILAELMDC